MSQILTDKPSWAKTVDPLGRPCKYPWHKWFDGQTHLLVRRPETGTVYGDITAATRAIYAIGDYETESRFFRHTVIRAAEKRDKSVEVIWRNGHNFEDGCDRMIVTAREKAPPPDTRLLT